MVNNLYPEHGLRGHRYRETYACLFAEQQGLCAVCERPIGDFWRWTSKITQLVIDHSHATGEIRALLCGQCNTHVGNIENGHRRRVEIMAQPVPDYIAKIDAYLERFKEKRER